MQQNILIRLRRDGIAITDVCELLIFQPLFEELQRAIAQAEIEQAVEIKAARSQTNGSGFKSYLIELLGPKPVLNLADIFVRFGLQPAIVHLSNHYFGMYTRLRAFNAWRHFASQTPPRNSQLWHRDPEDRFILKVFVYLSDVDERSGALCYAPGTHGYGTIKIEPESFGEGGTTARRSSDDMMHSVVPRDRWITAVGPKGTIVFADTRGYHKGGWVREGERLLYTCMFTSQGSMRNEYFKRALPIPFQWDRALAFALGI